jgi:hypothetical protein
MEASWAAWEGWEALQGEFPFEWDLGGLGAFAGDLP